MTIRMIGYKSMIIVRNLHKSFGSKKVLNNLNICFNNNEVIALLGPNGAGKTTLMRLMSGYYLPDAGEILINHHNLTTERIAALKNTAYVPEVGALYPEMTVYEYIKYMAELRRMSEQDFVDNLLSLLKELELENVINQKCETLSKGYKRRTAIAGALIHRPQTIILDEPTEGLDPAQKQSIRNYIKNYGKKNTVIISTHIMEEVEAMAERVILLNQGKVICDTTPKLLKQNTDSKDIGQAFLSLTVEK